jgi:hypothetical protein
VGLEKNVGKNVEKNGEGAQDGVGLLTMEEAAT